MNSSIVYIYGLRCPLYHCIMYVGRARVPKKRLVGHLCTGRMGYDGGKNEWIRRLMSVGLLPILEVIEKVDESIGDEREEYWIKHYRGLNPGLTNRFTPRAIERAENGKISKRISGMTVGQKSALELLGVSQRTLAEKIQPLMIELGEAWRRKGISTDVYYDDVALARWREFLSTLDKRGGRRKKVDYMALYKAWVEKEKQA